MEDPAAERDARLAFLEAVVDATSDAVVELADGVVLSWNRGAERLFGRPASAVLGEPMVVLFPVGARATMQWLLGIVESGDRIDRFEIDIESHHGTPTPVALTLLPAPDARGAAGACVVVAHDLTEQRLAQATLAETEARRREGEALAHTGRWLWDIGTGAVQWSEELHRIHGVDPWDFDGDRDAHLARVADRDRDRVTRALDDAVARRRAVEVEYEIVRPDGGLRRVYARAEPTKDVTGDVVGLCGTMTDITEVAAPG